MGSFENLLREGGLRVSTTTRIAPRRTPARGAQVFSRSPAEVAAAECFYECAVPVRQEVYKRLNSRFPNRNTDGTQKFHYDRLFNEAKVTLNEHRNQIIKDVLPLFQVDYRLKADTPLTEADQHAADYFVRNVFLVMTRTYLDWVPEFVEESEADVTREVLSSVANTHSERLESLLRNFSFRFRPVTTS